MYVDRVVDFFFFLILISSSSSFFFSFFFFVFLFCCVVVLVCASSSPPCLRRKAQTCSKIIKRKRKLHGFIYIQKAIEMKYECRIPVPLSLKEYEKGYTYSYVVAARNGNEKGDGDIDIEVPETEFDNSDGSMGISEFTSHAIPKGKGFYSRRKYNLGSQVPGYVKMIVPTSALYLVEEGGGF